ncbi:hypothetical protein [Curtobacterium sp. MCSS17_016]|uniref:hypothetical protein n=1 Tax=Curtobacterium sp. MCSS17_016 TaxID=2175644 RepID=UPI000DA8DEB5|nr:hypothetical protein [Curtobacterium sp. MCSS17_016]WIE81197.1 hypothetical protein DEJ19_018360 [Curtobacterium sp. MCSS17_016]
MSDDRPTETTRPNRFVTVLAIVGAAFLVTAGTLTAIRSISTPTDTAHTPGNPYTVAVWTAGGQDEIDECKGAVDLTKLYGIPTIAEHDRCGGDDFPKTAGTMIRLTGKDAGTYRVEGVVAHLNGKKNTSADIPRGYDLIYQTCDTGFTNMSFTALTKVRP